jgi:hypothetical protein
MDLFIHPRISSVKHLDIHWFESQALTELFEEVSSYVKNIRIEMVPLSRRSYATEENPAILIGLLQNKTAIRFIDSLDRRQRVEAIAHELAHLLMIYRYGLSLVEHRSFYASNSSQISGGEVRSNIEWISFLGQMTNTVHHLILVPYLREIYGIESGLHLQLLNNFCTLPINLNDRESHRTGGLIAYELERLIGKGVRWINLYGQSESFRKVFEAARKYFQEYGYPSIPSSSHYEENIFSFLEELGYFAGEFIFFPPLHSRQA